MTCGGALFNSPGATLRLHAVTVSRSRADDGGGVFNSGTLVVTDSAFSGNEAENGAGGGLFTTGDTRVSGSRFVENLALFAGGGIQISPGEVTVTGSAFVRNRAESTAGGVIDNLGGALVVRDSTFTGNEAPVGGGIMSANDGTLEVTGSTFSGNTAQSGGAIFTDGETTVVTNTTIAGNTGTSEGGGLVNNSALVATNVTFAANTGGAVVNGFIGTTTLRNTLLATGTGGPNCDGTITDGGGNLDDGTTCGFSDPTSQSDANPGLDPAGLQDNGRATPTIALVAGSDAIDRAVDALCAAAPVGGVDQRGFARPVDGDGDGDEACDVGAVEQGAGAEPPPPVLAHFLCYRTAASAGRMCSGASPAPGAACATEEDCGGEESVTAFCGRNTLPRGLQVVLTDRFEGGVRFDLEKLRDLCTPADKDGEDPEAPGRPDQLQTYKIKEVKGEPRHEKRAGILVQNQFGELRVDTVKPSNLLVPTAASETGPVPAPVPGIDHFRCYDVKVTKGAPAFEKRTVALVERFAQPRVLEVVKPAQLCAPADKNGEAPDAPAHPDHLLCYTVRTVRGEPKLEKVLGVHLSNQIAPARVDVKREQELCVPSQAAP